MCDFLNFEISSEEIPTSLEIHIFFKKNQNCADHKHVQFHNIPT